MNKKNLTDQAIKGPLFTNIFKTFRFAIQPGNLLLALMAVIAMCISGMLIDLWPTVVTSPGAQTEDFREAPGSGFFPFLPPCELHAAIGGREEWREYVIAYEGLAPPAGVSSVLWHFLAARFNSSAMALVRADYGNVAANLRMMVQAAWWAARYHTFHAAVLFAVTLVVMSLVGGAICRSAALQLAKDERPGLAESLRFSIRRFTSFISAPLWALGIIALTSLLIFLLGLTGNLGFGAGPVLLGLLSPLAILLGFVMVLFIIGSAAGASLMSPAVAFESTDGMGAMGRAFAYIYMRPWRAAFYALVATIYGLVCYLFVRLVAFLLLAMTRAFFGAGASIWRDEPVQTESGPVSLIDALWPTPMFDNLLGGWDQSLPVAERIGATLLRIPNLLFAGLLPAFLLSLFFCSSTVIYALLRKKADGEDFENIYIPDESAPAVRPQP
ncbi:MAG TPA: hypothetical protein VLH60_07535 [Sedimentisphaerales bacterium]|nr:hypothetical protein [Sedimentisphaerales bacterium]